jgi:hypothetical protein
MHKHTYLTSFKLSVGVAMLLIASQSNAQLTSKDFAVMLTASVDTVAPSITINWPTSNDATGYRVFRKRIETTQWGTELATPAADATSFVDHNVEKGSAYEYYVQRLHNNRLAHGYIYIGTVSTATTNRGRVLLLVDQNYITPLREEINQLKWDMAKDGWAVTEVGISRDLTAAQVKSTIKTLYTDANIQPKISTVYILGRIAVPYSGGFVAQQGQIYPPDGHAEHGGAWPTDVYYAHLESNFWTDESVNDTTPARPQNKNIAGDGKFDQMFLGDNNATLEVGRVYLNNMPAFAQSDTSLIKQYLNKAHAYKTGQTPIMRRALIDDHFGQMNGEAFAASAWRGFSTMFGDSVKAADYMTETKQGNYLFTYGCGAGTYTSASGVANTSQFTNDSVNQIFTMLFGSYFGDWDSQNNLLRAPLASKNGGLASAWSGRPHWHLHHMALGKHIGYSAKLTLNNFFTNGPQPIGYVHNICPTFISINLMGDPTLRLHMPEPPQNFSANPSADSMTVTLNWNEYPGAVAYIISKSTNALDGYQRHITVAGNATSYIDETPYLGYNTYLLRPVYIEQTPSGYYQNTPLGVIDSAFSINPVNVKSARKKEWNILIYPNPASNVVYIKNTNDTYPTIVTIMDINGKTVYQLSSTQNAEIDISHLQSGIYFIQLQNHEFMTTRKLSVYK